MKSTPLPFRLLILILIGAMLSIGAWLTQNRPSRPDGSDPTAIYILGPARSLLSAELYERADLYFHKGVPHHKKEAFNDFFKNWKEQISPTKHAHAQGQETMEIMPWLRMATRSDPHNMEAYLVASYWMEQNNNLHLAQRIMDEAIRKNPKRYEPHKELGRLYTVNNQYDKAIESLQTALKKMGTPKSEQAQIDQSSIYSTMSFLYESTENCDGAIKATEAFLRLNPDNPTFTERLATLRTGVTNPGESKKRLQMIFSKSNEDHEHEHAHEHAHEHK